ncbi:MAG: hypothetical protein LBL63_06215 [Clostridiales Family XIII bacterium]|jgi:hypothetical protein|nr:hypothetical protein [Clostridiales Family XIII bacterium]
MKYHGKHRRLGIFLSAILTIAVGVWPLYAFAAPGASISVADRAGTVAPGDEFSVPISIAGNPGFAVAIFSLSYNHNVLELRGLEGAGTMIGDEVEYDFAQKDTVGYLSDSLSDLTGDGVLFSLRFRVKGGAVAGIYPISAGLYQNLPKNFIDKDLNTVAVSFSSGGVRVASASQPPGDGGGGNPDPGIPDPGDTGTGDPGTGNSSNGDTGDANSTGNTGGTGSNGTAARTAGVSGTGSNAATTTGATVDGVIAPGADGSSATTGSETEAPDADADVNANIPQGGTPLGNTDEGFSFPWIWLLPIVAFVAGGLFFGLSNRRGKRA